VRYLLLLLPALMVVAFVVYPTVATVIHSFYRLDPVGRVTGFAGVANYRMLFAEPVFLQVLRNTAIYAVASVVLSIALAFGMAMLLSGKVFVNRLLLLGIFSPTVMPTIAAANIWLYFLAPQLGLFTHLLGDFGIKNANLLGEPNTALGALVALFVWKYAPYFTLFLMAGLQAIPQNVRDALRTEDPHGWHSLRKVVLPIMAPMLAFVITLAVIYAMETVDPVYVMTQGGPANGTNLVMFYLYQLGFSYYSWGPAAALSGLLLGGLSSLSALSLIALERRSFHWA
jgi:sn-glycerol 3-phosphate transport system permease protein